MADQQFLARENLDDLLRLLRDDGYRVIGPQVRDGAIVFDDLDGSDQLPRGWRDEQAPGYYRLNYQASPRCFSWANGPQALKPYVFAAHEPLWEVERDDSGTLAFRARLPESTPLAVVGARACDIAALSLQDRHFLDTIEDPYYAARRRQLLLIAVHCSHPADTCFCASTGDGPRAEQGFDLALSELDEGYLIEFASTAGEAIASRLPLTPTSRRQEGQADEEIMQAARRQTRHLPGGNLRAPLFANLNHSRWQAVGERCLACGNCTSVCPTCFCHAEYADPSLDGSHVQQQREWDSCFGAGHAYLHGYQVRNNISQRYRQWLTHKLGSWHDQYGRSGCTGCGRCIAWCPVGIDLTEEAAAICAAALPGGSSA